MTRQEKNKAVCKILGIEWHDVAWKDCGAMKIKYCSCGYKYLMGDLEHLNPDFCENAKYLLEELKKRDDWDNFRDRYFFTTVMDKDFVPIHWILIPELLVDEFIKWREK